MAEEGDTTEVEEADAAEYVDLLSHISPSRILPVRYAGLRCFFKHFVHSPCSKFDEAFFISQLVSSTFREHMECGSKDVPHSRWK